jgi:hypothetical protein
VIAFDDDTFILRQSKCVHFQAPFLYLLVGDETVLLPDTGASLSARDCPIRRVVDHIIADRLHVFSEPACSNVDLARFSFRNGLKLPAMIVVKTHFHSKARLSASAVCRVCS